MADTTPAYRHPRVRDLAELGQDWDSYGAPPISEAALRTADALSFVPTCDGGVQVEIHGGGWDVELSIRPDGAMGDLYVGKPPVTPSRTDRQPEPPLSTPTAQTPPDEATS